LASIEYAIEHLGSSLLVVMGHQSCGAVNATLSAKKGVSSGSPQIDALIKNISENISYTKNIPLDPKNTTPDIKANVRGVVISMVKKSKIIREAIGESRLVIAQAFYRLDNGRVEFMDVGRPIFIENNRGKLEDKNEDKKEERKE
jgi:carbonic anhydrase